ncbi:beta-crystallin A1-like [Huso huso]|uniref:Beta-crystallin A1-like n=1 Tax=Huso huso TaxID=61971 RepID=A0ABR0Y7I6_HUSHU
MQNAGVTQHGMGYAPFWKVKVWEQEYFQGKCQEFTSECCNIQDCGFDNVRSIRVESGAWVGFEHHDFQGQQFVLERGEYPRWEGWSGNLSYHVERLMSFRPVYCAVSTRYCTVLHCEYQILHSLHPLWVCYQYPGYRGYQYIMECEHHSGDYQHWKNWGSHAQTPQIQSIRRIQH